MIPKNITEEHVLQALNDIDVKGIRYPLTKSKKFDLVYNGKRYPPKYTISIANEFANNEYLSHKAFNTDEAQSYLKALSPSFLIDDKKEADPVLELLETYKTHIKNYDLEGEIYKWNLLGQFKGRPNLNAVDFYNEVKSIDYRNLIYPVGIGVIHHLAKDRTEAFRECFKVLFDDGKALVERIKWFNEQTLKVYREITPEEKFSHHQDERTMATFLTFFNPDKYTFFKNSFYQKYCKIIGIPAKKKGDKYVHYLELIDDLINEYIQDDEELLNLINSFIPPGSFDDKNHKLLAQDILYQTLDKQIGTGRNYWRIGTSDAENNYWEFMKANNKICIGWSELDDLDENEVKSKKDIENLLKQEGFYINDNRTLSRKAGEIFNFYNDVKKGDVVLAQDGAAVKGIGIVSGDYSYNENDGFSHQKEIEWKIESPNLQNSEGLRTTVYKLSDHALIKSIDSLLNLNSNNSIPNKENNNMDKLLNQILFGPPGTGKTYNTINKSLEIIGEEIEGKTRNEIKKVFDGRINDGQIVFTTFHQSMSYEDFVEGIKPIEPKKDGDPVIYKIIDGVFKKSCAMAAYHCYKLFTKSKPQFERYTFDDLYEAFTESIQEQIEKKANPVYKTLKGRDVEVKELNSNNSIIARAKNSIAKKSAPLTKENLQKLYDKFKTVAEIEDLKQVQETVGVTPRITEFYAVFSGLKEFETSFKPGDELILENEEVEPLEIEDILRKFNAGVYIDAVKEFGNTAEPVVIIIDEINRGNISQIFGELITLIEEDKRIGKDEALEVTLPYSKMKFSVPPNLYIIGTMNTADRSVEALDAALRRRFSFIEILPEPELIDKTILENYTDKFVEYYDLNDNQEPWASYENGFKSLLWSNKAAYQYKPLQKIIQKEKSLNNYDGVSSWFKKEAIGFLPSEILKIINRRIEKLLDKDHQIGHSYFMKVSNLEQLKSALQNKIIPLLQEYFFGDYGKIGLVLGKGFVETTQSPDANVFADFDGYTYEDFSERPLYQIRKVNYMTDKEFDTAISILLKSF